MIGSPSASARSGPTPCDLVILGPGWQHSTGAQAERAKADQIGIPVLEWAGGLNLGAILALAGRISMARQSEREHPAPSRMPYGHFNLPAGVPVH